MSKQPVRRRFHFGPGTTAMILGLVAFGAYTYVTQPGPAKAAYYEADARGQLRQVDRPTGVSRKPAPLWKPEPKHLLDHAGALGLTPEQRRSIGLLASDWDAKKRDLEFRMEQATKFMARKEGDRPSVASVQTSLAEYSHLSRDYGSQREQAWTDGLALLTPDQVSRLAELPKAPGVGS